MSIGKIVQKSKWKKTTHEKHLQENKDNTHEIICYVFNSSTHICKTVCELIMKNDNSVGHSSASQ